MHFLITRPKPDANALAARLEVMGHTSSSSPVMKVIYHQIKPPAPTSVSGLVITSTNTLRSLESFDQLAPFCPLPLFAVGKRSAKAAQKRGFSQIYQAKGKAETLAPLINQHLADRSKPLYHPGGKQKAFELSSPLDQMGYSLIEQIVYETQMTSRLTPETIKGLEASTIDAVILLSPRSARLFCNLIKAHKLDQTIRSLACLCLSQNVAKAADQLDWQKKWISSRPDMDHLLDLVDQMSRSAKK